MNKQTIESLIKEKEKKKEKNKRKGFEKVGERK